jgi:glutathione synthase
MKVAFVVDPPSQLKPYKDSSIAMMGEARRRGHALYLLEAREIFVREASVRATVRRIELTGDAHDWFRADADEEVALSAFDLVMMRKDPPFDQEYYYATLLLERAEAAGARVVNRPGALRDWNEKLAILRFPSFTPPTLVTSDAARLHAFIDEHADVVVKKLDGMGGAMIFRVGANDPNRNVILETVTAMGTRTIMAQRFVPEIASGDKRVLVIDGKPFSHVLARIPKPGETRGNLAAGGRGVARPLSGRDREIAETVGPVLAKEGIVFAGLDVIGDSLTEINVTSPTCIVEIREQTGADATRPLFDALEGRARG